MQEFDARHLLAALGDLNAVTHQDEAVVDSHGGRRESKDHLCPDRRQGVEFDGVAVKVTQQSVVVLGVEFEGTHEAGDTEQFAANSKCRSDGGKPKEGQVSAESGSKQANSLAPVEPKIHGKA